MINEIKDKEYILTSWIYNLSNPGSKCYKRLDKIKSNEPNEFSNYHYCCVGKFIDMKNQYDSRDKQNYIVLTFEVTNVISTDIDTFNYCFIDKRETFLYLYYDVNDMDIFNNVSYHSDDWKYETFSNPKIGNIFGAITIKNYGNVYSLNNNYFIHFVENKYNLSEIKDYLENTMKYYNLRNIQNKIEQLCKNMNIEYVYDYFYKLVRYKEWWDNNMSEHTFFYNKIKNKNYFRYKYYYDIKYAESFRKLNLEFKTNPNNQFEELNKICDNNDLYLVHAIRDCLLNMKENEKQKQQIKDLITLF